GPHWPRLVVLAPPAPHDEEDLLDRVLGFLPRHAMTKHRPVEVVELGGERLEATAELRRRALDAGRARRGGRPAITARLPVFHASLPPAVFARWMAVSIS